MSASEKLKALDERASDLTLGFIMGEDDGSPSPWPPNLKELERLRLALPQIVELVEAAEVVDNGYGSADFLAPVLRALDEALEPYADIPGAGQRGC